MKRIFIVLWVSTSAITFHCMFWDAQISLADENTELLPERLPLYHDAKNASVINYPVPGMKKTELATINRFKGSPGCYIACYSHQEKFSAYSVGDQVYVMGQVRVPGMYSGRICLPRGFEKSDISSMKRFKKECGIVLPEACPKETCWAGGDTGGWFGISEDEAQ